MTENQARAIQAVVFDVGETLCDETRAWTLWADWLGIPALTLHSVLGAVIERGEDHRRVFEILRPGLDVAAESRRKRASDGFAWAIREDLYPDALPALEALTDAGYRLGVAGNQPIETEAFIGSLGIDVDLVASSESLGVAKPDPAFFEQITRRLGLAPSAIAYVGDRLDNDVRPAAGAGMRAIWIRRGPWGLIQSDTEAISMASGTIDTLLELPDLLASLE
ncbi:MAG: HAD family hydrolase [Chloroflexota bacterium]